MTEPKKVITNIADIPPAFDLKKYAPIANFGPAEWYEALKVREVLNFEIVDSVNRNRPDFDHTFFAEFFADPLNSMVVPCYVPEIDFDEPETDFDEPKFRTHGEYFEPCPLRTLNVGELHDFSVRVRKDRSDPSIRLMQYFDERRKNIEPHWPKGQVWNWYPDEAMWDFGHTPVDSIINTYNLLYLSVDTSCSDDLLVEAFKQKLTEKRSAQGINPRKTGRGYPEKTLKNWHSLGVLPYIDLTLWAKRNQCDIKPAVYNQAIYPPGYDDNNQRLGRINSTVKPLADKLFSSETFSTLSAQIRVNQN